MAITKVINKPAKTRAGLRNVTEYILRDDKVKEGYVTMIGPAPDKIDWDSVYNSFLDEKKIWGKESGRMCAHYVLSFHADEKVSPDEVLDLATELAEKTFDGFQVVIAVHQDRDHLHAHLLVNSVSYVDGMKLQSGPEDLRAMKDLTNELCKQRGLSVAEKGKHFDGTSIATGEGIAWNKNTYRLINDSSKPSYLIDCAIAVQDAVAASDSQEVFIREMKDRGWLVAWSDNRKHITFQDKEGHKVRDSKLSKTFSLDISKERLLDEFRRQAEANRGIERELESYYRQAEEAARSDRETVKDDRRAEISDIAAERRAVEDAEAQSRATEQQRRSAEQKRRRHKGRSEQGYSRGD